MLFVLLITFAILYFTIRQWNMRSKYPHGPIPFPLIGNLPQVIIAAKKHGGIVGALKLFEKEYGKVFTIWFGPVPTVHISDYDVAQDVMVKTGAKYVDRYVPAIMNELRDGLGVVVSNGEQWQDHRRFALHTLRNFGLGRNLMEDRIMDEVNTRFSEIDRDSLNGVTTRNLSQFFDFLVGSIINSMIFSTRFEENDHEFMNLKARLDETFEKMTIFDTLVPVSLFRSKIMAWRFKTLLGPFENIKFYLRDQIERRIAQIKSGDHVIGDEPEDFVDAFLMKMKKDENENQKTNFSVDSLVIDVVDLWIAGQETTSTTLMWAIIFLLNNPSEIEKLRKELLEVTGDGRSHISLKDRPNTPYLNAVIMEIQRCASLLNINLWRQNKEDTMVDGQPLAAGAIVAAQLSLILSDQKVFKDSDKFNPSRFLDDAVAGMHVIPFGIGKRSCLGESLARAELYLVIANLFLRYDLQSNGPLPDTQPINLLSIMRRPKKFEAKFTRLH